MRLLAKCSVAMAACLLCASSASAAFTYSFVPPDLGIPAGSSGMMTLQGVSSDPLDSFTLLGLNFQFVGGQAGQFSETHTTNAGPIVANGTTQTLGTVTVTVAPGASFGDMSTLTSTIAGTDLGGTFFQVTGPSAIVAVPEPSSLSLLGLAGLALLKRRRRKA